MTRTLTRLGYYVSEPGGAPQPRYVSNHEILFELITAGAVYSPDRQTPPLHGAGWVFVHQPGGHTVWRTPPDGHYECLAGSFATPSRRDRALWPPAFCWQDANQAVSFAHEVLYAFHHTRVDSAVLGDYVWSQFRFRLDLFQRHSKEEVPPRLAAVMAHIEQRYATPLTLADLAEQAGISASHLHADFRRHLKTTPHQYLIRQRMKAARHALATSNAPIKAVAREVGYANTEHFCRAFKRHAGLTAAAYRQQFWVHR